jgi:hypothetical protein
MCRGWSVRPIAFFFEFLFAMLIAAGGSHAQEVANSCQISGPWYWLNSDKVDWGMSLGSGKSCARGVRNNLATLDEIKLISPPAGGHVFVEGPAFIYRSDPDFVGQDTFELSVSGRINRIQGVSIIRVTVFVRK